MDTHAQPVLKSSELRSWARKVSTLAEKRQIDIQKGNKESRVSVSNTAHKQAKDEAQPEEPPKVFPPSDAVFGSKPWRQYLPYQRHTKEQMSWMKVLNFLKTRNQLTSLRRRPGEKFDSLFVLSEHRPMLETFPLIL